MDNKGNAIIVWSQSDGSVTQVFKAEYGIGRWLVPGGMTDNLSLDGVDAQDPQVAMDFSGNTIISWEAKAIYKAEYGFDADSDGYNVWRDCNDANHGIHPGAMEIGGDGIDSNCDGFDYPDMDSDGFPADLDCNDIDATIYPGAIEQPCDGIDQNCNGLADDDPDADGDGVSLCAGDCNDGDPTVYPGATEVTCDGIDQNCNGPADDDPDADGDGVSLCAGDCDDTDPNTFPGQPGWFTTVNLGGSFDYDCNGAEEMQFPDTSTVMPYPDCFLTPGWDQTIPACGMSGNYIDSATPNSGTQSCDTSLVVQTQACH
ncbi:hypothetical protein C2E25_15760 [Geothermobacter hydrogeniphilus]|uniref:Metal-binding motif-containing protein n=2 Tax=Geothermobacter hydrogeniphilus TaxID=1969733 RepID=A0A2K2H6C4_9BACT|nr:hypothetical protein C2E25_15760 [Geothermobacter hydrogeniphilus]